MKETEKAEIEALLNKWSVHYRDLMGHVFEMQELSGFIQEKYLNEAIISEDSLTYYLNPACQQELVNTTSNAKDRAAEILADSNPELIIKQIYWKRFSEFVIDYIGSCPNNPDIVVTLGKLRYLFESFKLSSVDEVHRIHFGCLRRSYTAEFIGAKKETYPDPFRPPVGWNDQYDPVNKRLMALFSLDCSGLFTGKFELSPKEYKGLYIDVQSNTEITAALLKVLDTLLTSYQFIGDLRCGGMMKQLPYRSYSFFGSEQLPSIQLIVRKDDFGYSVSSMINSFLNSTNQQLSREYILLTNEDYNSYQCLFVSIHHNEPRSPTMLW